MRYPADSRPVSLSLILAVLFLLSGCTALDRDNHPYAGESLPVQPPTPRSVPDKVTLPVPPSHPILADHEHSENGGSRPTV